MLEGPSSTLRHSQDSVPNVCLEMRKRDLGSAAPVAWNLLGGFFVVFFSICDIGHDDLSVFILLMLGSEIILSVTVICCVSIHLLMDEDEAFPG